MDGILILTIMFIFGGFTMALSSHSVVVEQTSYNSSVEEVAAGGGLAWRGVQRRESMRSLIRNVNKEDVSSAKSRDGLPREDERHVALPLIKFLCRTPEGESWFTGPTRPDEHIAHIALTESQTETRLFFNGREVASCPPPSWAGEPLPLHSHERNTSRVILTGIGTHLEEYDFKKRMDTGNIMITGARVWNRSLSMDEIFSSFHSGTCGGADYALVEERGSSRYAKDWPALVDQLGIRQGREILQWLKGLLQALKPQDRWLITKVSRLDYSLLEQRLMQICTSPNGPEFIHMAFSNLQILPDSSLTEDLNKFGLSMLRALLAERLTEQRRERFGYSTHPDYTNFMRDGILVRPFPRYESRWREVGEVVRMAAGDRLAMEGVEGFRERIAVHSKGDPNYMLHTDTFFPTIKVWIFENVTIEQGPFEYIPGSNKNTEEKLRWIHNNALGTFTADDPKIVSIFGKPMAVTAGSVPLLVVADTSGFHRRGAAKPGVERVSQGLSQRGWFGLEFMTRRNPFRLGEDG